MFKEGKKSKLKQLKRLNKAKHFSRQSYSIKNQRLLLKKCINSTKTKSCKQLKTFPRTSPP